MSKVASYLRGHLSGEVITRKDVVSGLASDAGIMRQAPEMAIYPRTTNDIRKVVRFCWQLAEKGHVMPVTVAGAGLDPTGGAVGAGIVLTTTTHMNNVFEYDSKQRLIRLQPGASVSAVSNALGLQAQQMPSLMGSQPQGTVGGAISVGVIGGMAGKYGGIAKAVDQLEVVLANGDTLQTERISRRELEKRKGIQGFVGDIYRDIDAIIEENAELLNSLRSDDSTGYNSIADVKQANGSFDLAPLFIGAQGTLGIISEMIMRTVPRNDHYAVGAYVYEKHEDARDAFDLLCQLDPEFIDYFDATLFDTAAKSGKIYEFYAAASENLTPAAVIIIGFDDPSPRKRAKHIKRLKSIAKKTDTYLVTADVYDAEELIAAADVIHATTLPDQDDHMTPGIFTGFQVPGERFEDFYKGLQEISKKLDTSLPLSGHIYTGIYGIYPVFDLKKVSEKQKMFKLLDLLAQLVHAHGGAFISEGSEGRLKSKFVYPLIDPRLVKMYDDIKNVFDPRGILNPGVKQPNELKDIAAAVKTPPDLGGRARFGY